MSERCECDVFTNAPVWHGKKRSGTLTTRQGAKHLSACSHSDLELTTKRYKPRRIRAVPGTRRLIAIDIDEPKRECA